MISRIPHFNIPLNLPHAGTIAARLVTSLQRVGAPASAIAAGMKLFEMLAPYRESGENPSREEAQRVVAEAAAIGRAVVDAIESEGVGEDRLGQAVRNLFECLELGKEGAVLSLRAGENPKSALRPN